MNLPLEITQAVLNELAQPAETGATRILLLKVANSGPFRMSGRKRKYVFTRNNEAGGHVLDVPDSLWQHDLPTGAYRENNSLCHDLQNPAGLRSPLIFLRIPWGENGIAPTLTSRPVAVEPVQDFQAVNDTAAIIETCLLRVAELQDPEKFEKMSNDATANIVNQSIKEKCEKILNESGRAGTVEWLNSFYTESAPEAPATDKEPEVKAEAPATPKPSRVIGRPSKTGEDSPAAKRMRKMRENQRAAKALAAKQAAESPVGA